jgi:hypothetical protein
MRIMSCLGVLFAIDSATAKRLLAASEEEVKEIVEEVEDEWAADFVMETDKAWDAIHRALSDGTLDADGGEYPLNRAILGGKQLEAGDDYIVSLVPKKEVPDVAKALAAIDEADFRRRYETIVPKDYAPEYGDEDLAYSWSSFQDLARFYARAAGAGRAVIFTVDQ